MIAVSAGHLDIVRMLLATRKVDVEQSNSSGARPLHYACSKNYYEVIRTSRLRDAGNLSSLMQHLDCRIIIGT